MDIIEIGSSESDDDFEVSDDESLGDTFSDAANQWSNSPQFPIQVDEDEPSIAPYRSPYAGRDELGTINNSELTKNQEVNSPTNYPSQLSQRRTLPLSFQPRFSKPPVKGVHERPVRTHEGFGPSSASAVGPNSKLDDRGKEINEFDMHRNNGKHRALPPSFANHKHVEDAQSKDLLESRGKSNYFANSSHYVGGHASNGVNQRSFFDNSFIASTGSTQGDMHINGNAGTHRVLPPSLTYGNSTNGLPPVAGTDLQHRSNLVEDRHFDCDERVIYQQALQDLGQPKFEDDLPKGLLSVSLLKHQKIALAWMVQKEKSVHCAGGILADDQGLGKTVSTIALIQKQKSQQSKFTSDDSNHVKPEALNLDEDDDGVTVVDKSKEITNNEPKCESSASHADEEKQNVKPETKQEPGASSSKRGSNLSRPAAGTLVVCPASVLRQWARELEDKVTESAKLSVLVYHGGSRTKNPSDLAKYDVVLTTYTIVTNEVPKQSVTNDDDGEQKNLDKFGVSSEFAPNKKRKTPSSSRSKAKKRGKGLKDSQLDIGSGPLARVRWFRVVLDEAQTIKNYRTQVARACCGLRAKRRWCLSGTPIQNAIDELYSYFRFLKYDPYSVYSSFCASIKYPISRNASHGYKKLQAILRTVLLRRSKVIGLAEKSGYITDYQITSKTISLKRVDFSPEERAFYLKLEANSRQQFKEYAAAGTLKQNYASILLLLLRLRQACDHPLLVKGHHSDNVGSDSLEMARQLPRDMQISLLSKLEGSSAICSICSDPPEDAVVTMCGHVFCFQCVHERLTGDENQCPATGCKDFLATDSVFSHSTLKLCVSGEYDSNASTSSSADEEPSIGQSGYISSKIRAALGILNSLCSPSSIGLQEYSEVDSVSVRTYNMITNGSDFSKHSTANPENPVKAIVFSQWTSMLDLLELSLNRDLIQYRRLDGTMSLNMRDRAVRDFNTDPEVRVMIMSLKAGNLGLNMVAACHVILLDLWWNPYAEDQAVDRAHRIGQTRPVTVSRLTVKDTVEDRILALQEEKRRMVSSAFGEGAGGHTTRLTVEDLRYLFMV
uniref:Helicase-like transcription factor CHR28 n=1 Tax=Ananas comosus var. bracteatus TaxID=296719 RepID=A0A6V7QZ65_ANACO